MRSSGNLWPVGPHLSWIYKERIGGWAYLQTKKEHTTFHLNVQFSSAVKGSTRSQTETTIKKWIKDAARCYRNKPVLKNHPEWKRNVKGVFNNLPYTTGRELRKLMDDKFDNIVGQSEAEDWLQILVVDSAKTTKEQLLLRNAHQAEEIPERGNQAR